MIIIPQWVLEAVRVYFDKPEEALLELDSDGRCLAERAEHEGWEKILAELGKKEGYLA